MQSRAVDELNDHAPGLPVRDISGPLPLAESSDIPVNTALWQTDFITDHISTKHSRAARSQGFPHILISRSTKEDHFIFVAIQ